MIEFKDKIRSKEGIHRDHTVKKKDAENDVLIERVAGLLLVADNLSASLKTVKHMFDGKYINGIPMLTVLSAAGSVSLMCLAVKYYMNDEGSEVI